jgi:hypothetical protein
VAVEESVEAPQQGKAQPDHAAKHRDHDQKVGQVTRDSNQH